MNYGTRVIDKKTYTPCYEEYKRHEEKEFFHAAFFLNSNMSVPISVVSKIPAGIR